MDFKRVEELWQAYPLDFIDYKREWAMKYTEEEARILEYIEEEGFEGFVRIGHIGSTAVLGLSSRPVIDLLLEIKKDADLEELKEDLARLGYELLEDRNDQPPYIMGYRQEGEVFYHIHIRYMGRWDEFYLRDHLNRNEESLKEYEKKRRELWERYGDDRLKYRSYKKEMEKKYVELEKEEYRKYIEELNRGFES